MREIRFRAIHKLTKHWFEDIHIIYQDGEWFEDYRALEDWRPMNLEQVAIMQYTGKKDEDGAEMYSGDIVEIDGGPSIIKNVPGGFTVAGLPLVAVSNYGMKVIGNICENPELLERK